ncbi:MAG TPA: MFS transporter [Chloroflexota bacterium]|nr:MFS transporter [Chloroflexota bacterium]
MSVDTAVSTEAIPGSTAGAAAPKGAVPAIIRRNARLLTAAEAFVGTGQQMVPTLGALMVIHLTNSPALAGIASSILGLTRVMASYPSGRLADAHGRKIVLVIGVLLSLAGALTLGGSMLLTSFPVFIAGLLLFGVGNGTSQQQRRLSAADMYPPERRAQGLGYVLTGSLVGALGGPVIISLAGVISRAGGMDQMALSWLLVPFMLIPSLAFVLRIHPDPKQIALALERYWPGYQAPARRAQPLARVTIWTFTRNYPHVVAFVSMFVLYGNMSMMMALTPMAMHAHGVALAAVSMTVSLHVVGMYGLSLPIGKLADALGRRPVMFAGIVLSTCGTILVALTASFPLMLLGLYLVGLGWSCGNVTTAAMVADTTPPQFRGRAMGANTSFSAAASMAAPLLGGVLVQLWGTPSLVAVTLIFIVPTAVLLARLRETKPGVYAHASTF